MYTSCTMKPGFIHMLSAATSLGCNYGVNSQNLIFIVALISQVIFFHGCDFRPQVESVFETIVEEKEEESTLTSRFWNVTSVTSVTSAVQNVQLVTFLDLFSWWYNSHIS